MSSDAVPEGAAHTSEASANGQLSELRELLVGRELRELERIRDRLEDPTVQIEGVARALPEAVALRSSRDDRLVHALRLPLDEALKASVRRNPKVLAEAIAPALGPAIRRSIRAALLGMIQSMNQTLNEVFSVQGLRWRIQALRTGRPFAEVVLLNTLVFRVEGLMLIHRETGVVLSHVVHPEVVDPMPDSDVVSAMLSAIQSFVEDAFAASEEGLETVRIGSDRSLWIEQERHTALAALIWGTPPMELRQRLREVLEACEVSTSSVLETFDGNVAPFQVVDSQLEECLTSQTTVRHPARRTSPLLWGVAAALVLLPLALGLRWSVRHGQWTRLLDQLSAEPGLVVTNASASLGSYRIEGLRDPMSSDPGALLSMTGLPEDRVQFQWRAFQSIEPEIVLARAMARLEPPSAVRLEVRDQTLVASGTAEHDWVRFLLDNAVALPGIAALDVSGLVDWDLQALDDAIRDLEEVMIFARWASPDLVPGQDERLTEAVEAIRRVQNAQWVVDEVVQIVLIGYSDASGPERFNLSLSRARADLVRDLLVQRGVAAGGLLAVGGGVRPNAGAGDAQSAPSRDRGVMFRVLGAPRHSGGVP